MLRMDKDKCLQQTLIQEKEELARLRNVYAPYKGLPLNKVFHSDLVSKYTVQDVLNLVTKQEAVVTEYETRMTPHNHLCEGCTDPYYLTRSGLGRIDCPLREVFIPKDMGNDD